MEKQLKKTVWLYYVFSFATGCNFISAVLIPFFTDWGSLSITEAQLLQSWFALCIFALEVPTGVIADRVGRKKSLMMGAVAAMAGSLIYGSYPCVVLFAIGEFLLATNVAFVSGADQALIYDALRTLNREAQITKVVSQARMMHLAGIFVGAPLGGLAASKWGLNAPMLLTTVPYAIAFMVVLFIPEIRSDEHKQATSLSILKHGFVQVASRPQVLRLSLNMTLVAAAAYAAIWRYQLVMTELGIGVGYFGLAHAFMVAAETIVLASFGWYFSKRVSINTWSKITAILVTLGFFLVGLVPSMLTLVLFLILAGGFGLTRIELLTAHVSHLFEPEYRATSLSSVSMFRRLSLVILNPIMGALTDWSLSNSLVIIGLLPLLTLLFPLPREE